jgi:hypothetical protein
MLSSPLRSHDPGVMPELACCGTARLRSISPRASSTRISSSDTYEPGPGGRLRDRAVPGRRGVACRRLTTVREAALTLLPAAGESDSWPGLPSPPLSPSLVLRRRGGLCPPHSGVGSRPQARSRAIRANAYEMSKPDTLFVLAASYDTVADADADYQAVKALYHDVHTSHDFDAAVITRNEDGRLKVVKKREEPTRHGAAKGLVWGLAIGAVTAVLPAAALVDALVVGGGAGSAVGAVRGHMKRGMKNDDPRSSPRSSRGARPVSWSSTRRTWPTRSRRASRPSTVPSRRRLTRMPTSSPARSRRPRIRMAAPPTDTDTQRRGESSGRSQPHAVVQPGGGEPEYRAHHRLELATTLLLRLAAVATAWATYQSARWHGQQSIAQSGSIAARVESTRAENLASLQSSIDVAIFTQWIDATAHGDTKLAGYYRRLFPAGSSTGPSRHGSRRTQTGTPPRPRRGSGCPHTGQ